MGSGSGASASVSGAVWGTKRAPHSLQTVLSTGFIALHMGQCCPETALKSAPQSLQNLLPSLLAVPQFGQKIIVEHPYTNTATVYDTTLLTVRPINA
jgi:hypothetical protein